MRPIRVLIVEDSAVVREFLLQIIAADPRLEVAGAVASAEEALPLLARLSPDVISLDIRLPGMQGVEATRRIMSERPTPIVVVSACSESDDLNLSMEALKAGALALVEKPAATTHRDYAALAERLCTQLAIMSEVKVVRQRRARAPLMDPPQPPRPARLVPYRMVAVAASTGGPAALMELLGGLGKDFPLPVLLVQHMTPGFLEGFGRWLAGVTPFRVQIVTDRQLIEPGTVYLAPAGRHLVADCVSSWAEDGEPVWNQRPSGDVLFQSVARYAREASLGILLTGMGEDGARGLKEMRLAGGYTIAEHESTAAVYGMPAAGIRLGAACEALPLPAIAPRVLELVSPAKEVLR